MMTLRKYLRINRAAVIASVYALINALFWLALRPCWSGISKVLGAEKNQSFFIMQTPLLICIFLWLFFAFSALMLIFRPTKLAHKVITFLVNALITAGIIVIIYMGAYEYLRFVFPSFFASMIIPALVIIFAYFLFLPPFTYGKRDRTAKCIIFCVVLAVSAFCAFGVKINYITYEPVVYAVEDKYQIVFSTNADSYAHVEIGDDTYYSLYNGRMATGRIHKIEVPQVALDAAREYMVVAQAAIYSGPFGGYTGRTIDKSYNFRAANAADGFNYYSISDIHGATKGAVKAASVHAEKTDLLIIAGDVLGMIDTHRDANYVNHIAHKITKGNFPVIYARGNHETKGAYADRFDRYTASKDGKFYYTVNLLSVNAFGVVLDFGESHADDWWEFYDKAQYDLYRAEQTQFLLDIESNVNFDSFAYRLAVCHIPPVVKRSALGSFTGDWTEILNRFDIDMCISGHVHQLYPLVPGTSGTSDKLHDANFPNFTVSRRSSAQTDTAQVFGANKFIGLLTEVNLSARTQVATFNNAAGGAVSVFNPFSDHVFDSAITMTVN